MRRNLCLTLGLTAVFALCSPARAALITWEFEGIVRLRTLDGLPAVRAEMTSLLDARGAVVGAHVSGSITFDPAVSDSNATSVGFFEGAIVAGSLEIAGWLWALDPTFGTSIVIGVTPTHFYWASVPVGDSTGTVSGPALFGLDPESLDPTLFVPTDVLPADPPPVTALIPFGLDPNNTAGGYGSEIWFGATYDTPSPVHSSFSLQSEITRITRVPEPAAAALAALVALATVSRLRRPAR